jgi:hypothetical protein
VLAATTSNGNAKNAATIQVQIFETATWIVRPFRVAREGSAIGILMMEVTTQ